ncbi:MAG: hypothetical protein A4E55_02356 [Pelotomaculum sp. PtaU1.Bin035]|nr:MAG: hypothetical protein A4E55_02356 [Pelotomaculum sp. PtaU1.Bin035]
MANTNLWKTRPVFVSSTFRDMQAERDHLRDVVFPELAERLRARRCHLEPVDLRWGVDTVSISEQEAKELLVLKVCLDEIERCRPFLVVLLGDRYGWVPPERRMQAAIDEQGYATSIQDKSVTALEIEFGVLDSPEQQKRSFFYFREPLPYQDMTSEKAREYSDQYNSKTAWERLQALKKRITEEMGPDRVRHYQAAWDWDKQKVTGLDEWGKQVLEDLWGELEAKTGNPGESPAASWQEQERAVLDEFIEERSRDFVGRVEILTELRRLALSDKKARTGASW